VDKKRILAMVMSGGKGERLFPLTGERSKPSVPFGGRYRLIDFPLSNLINSGIYSIYVLVQYKSQSLIEHVRTAWQKAGVLPEHFVTVVPPQMRLEAVRDFYRGTADAIYQNINLIYDFKPDMVMILSSDHIYRMDMTQMVDFHLRRGSDVTVSAIPVPSSDAFRFGIVDLGHDHRVRSFREKPTLSGKGSVYASMGNYIFSTDALIRAVEKVAASRGSSHDFGKDILPYMVKNKGRVIAYDFSSNRIPGLREYEEPCYWRDVGTIASYWSSNMDLLGRHPRLDLFNKSWPIYTSDLNIPPSCFVSARLDNVLTGEGTHVFSSSVKNSILGRGVKIEEGCSIEDSIIMDFTIVGKGSRIRKTIVDRFNLLEVGTTIGFDLAADAKKYHLDKTCGIVVVKRGSRKAG